jgi:hypothetical protein
MGGKLHADPNAISKYASDLLGWGMGATTRPAVSLHQMGALASEAFFQPSAGGLFAEASVMMATVDRNSSMFEQFLTDVQNGILAIANAAQVCADTYRNTDAQNAESIDTINYAFADPGAARPSGLPKGVSGETLAEWQLAHTPAPVDAANTTNTGWTVVNFPGYTLTIYPDGSSRAITTTYPKAGVVRVETEVTRSDRTIVGDTIQTTEYLPSYAGDITIQTIENVNGDTSTGTVVTTAPDGTQSIQNTKNGKPTGDPEIVKPTPPLPEGPVQQALQHTYPGWHFPGITDYGDAKPPERPLFWPADKPPDSYGPTPQSGS